MRNTKNNLVPELTLSITESLSSNTVIEVVDDLDGPWKQWDTTSFNLVNRFETRLKPTGQSRFFRIQK